MMACGCRFVEWTSDIKQVTCEVCLQEYEKASIRKAVKRHKEERTAMKHYRTRSGLMACGGTILAEWTSDIEKVTCLTCLVVLGGIQKTAIRKAVVEIDLAGTTLIGVSWDVNGAEHTHKACQEKLQEANTEIGKALDALKKARLFLLGVLSTEKER